MSAPRPATLLDRLRGRAPSLLGSHGIDVEQAKLLWATLLSARHRRLNPTMIGVTFQGEPQTITPEIASAFAAATGDNDLRLDGTATIAPPFLVGRLVLPLVRAVLVHPGLRLNILRMVHAEQEIQWLRAARPGDTVRMQLTISAIEQTAAGELLQLTGEALRGDELLGRAITGLMVRGGDRRDRGTRPPRKATAAEAQHHELFRLTVPTTKDQALRYADASGDHNFIHTSELLARLAGLPGTILHGMCVLAMSHGAVVRHHLDGDSTRCAGIRARFSHPARPGQPLTVVGSTPPGWGPHRLAFEVLDPRGKQVIKQGELALRSA